MLYRLDFTVTTRHVGYVEAESESAARQAYIDNDLDLDYDEDFDDESNLEQVRAVIRQEVDGNGITRDIFTDDGSLVTVRPVGTVSGGEDNVAP